MPMGPAPTILIVDDYPDALDVWELYLRSSGFVVLTASDGLQALSLAREALPGVIVMDLELPGLSGIEVARALRSNEPTCRIPLIAVTGHSDRSELAEAQRAGFDALIVKPCDPPTLVAEIHRLLRSPPSPESG